MKAKDQRKRERRLVRRFDAPFHVRLEPTNNHVGPIRECSVANLSLSGFYFLSDAPYDVGSELQFSVPFVFRAGRTSELLAGTSRVVRCGFLKSAGARKYGIAAKIEVLTHQWGEEERRKPN